MLSRTFDAARINEILNLEEVRADVADLSEGVMDISESVKNQKNVLLLGEHGGTMYYQFLPGIYEVHTVATLMGRGKWIAEFCERSLDWMFTHTEAFEVTTRVPVGHRGARFLALRSGLMPEFTRENGCIWRGERQDVEVLSLRIQDWIKRSDAFAQKGADFHDFLHAEAVRLGIKEAPHDDDREHNKYVGSALEMIENGCVTKAIAWFNRWAVAARQPVVSLLSSDPVAIKMDLGILKFKDGEMRVDLPC